MPTLGQHYLLDFTGCDAARLSDVARLRGGLVAAAKLAGATVVGEVFHAFQPHGASGVVLLAESHLAIHTWPEHAAAAVDLFSCTDRLDLAALQAFLMDVLGARAVQLRSHPRLVVDAEAMPYAP